MQSLTFVSHITSACVAGGYRTGQYRYRTFLSLQKVLRDSTSLDSLVFQAPLEAFGNEDGYLLRCKFNVLWSNIVLTLVWIDQCFSKCGPHPAALSGNESAMEIRRPHLSRAKSDSGDRPSNLCFNKPSSGCWCSPCTCVPRADRLLHAGPRHEHLTSIISLNPGNNTVR